MKPLRPSRLLLALPAAALALSTTISNVSANHSWNGYHWARTSNPFTVKLGDNLTTQDWKGHLSQTSTDWSKSTVLDTTIAAGQSTSKRCSATAGRDEICNGSYGQNGWLGVAQIWASGSHITQGTVKVNDTYFSMSKYNNSAEKEHVMCQEVGHTFGLDHQDTSGASLNTCMDYYQNTSSSDTKSTTPNQHDYDELSTIYQHLDSTTTLGAAATGPGNHDLPDQADWGQLVRASANGRESVYVRDFGGNERAITFVYWAN